MKIAAPLDFPATAPEGFEPLAREPEFVPSRHLALETPAETLTLADLGYGAEDIEACPSDFGVTSPFRLLTDEGAACLLETCHLLEPYASGNFRISRNVRGGVYRSRFLRDLCLSPDVAAFMSQICGTPLAPHAMPHQLGHINYNPRVVGENVDKWHVDTLRFDYVLFVTDPKSVEGGEFQYFRGTKHEMQGLAADGRPMPPDRVVSPDLPAAGYAVVQQGNMVVHRAKGLSAPGERITMVNGYVPAEVGYPDFTRFDQLWLVDPKHASTAEFARQTAWIAGELLRHQADAPVWTGDRDYHAARLRKAIAILQGAVEQIETADQAREEHFGDG